LQNGEPAHVVAKSECPFPGQKRLRPRNLSTASGTAYTRSARLVVGSIRSTMRKPGGYAAGKLIETVSDAQAIIRPPRGHIVLLLRLGARAGLTAGWGISLA